MHLNPLEESILGPKRGLTCPFLEAGLPIFEPGARVANRPLPSIKYRESSSKLTLQKFDANKFFGWFPAAGKSNQRCFECLTNQASLILGQLRCAHGQVKHVDGLLSFGINQSHFDIAC